MKILRIIPSMNPKHGGPSQGIRNSIPALRDLGVDNEVVCLDDPNEVFISESSFLIHALGNSTGGWAYNKTLEVWLRNNLQNYSIVIVHGLWLYPSYIALKVYNQLKKRGESLPEIYVMPHGMLDPWFQRDKSRRIKALRNYIYWWLLEKKVVNSSNGLLFTCEQELLLARTTFSGYKPVKELNIGYGIQAPPAKSNSMDSVLMNKPYWLFLSRIHPKKGIDLLITAYKKLLAENSNIPDLVIAGPKDGVYAKEMINLAADCAKIHFPGQLQGDRKWGAFYGAECFVLPSHQENFGIAVVEALACGTPVLISNQVNIWREIEEGKGGLVGENTNEGVYNLLKNWVIVPQQAKEKFKVTAREVFLNRFSVEQAAQKMKEMIIDK